MLKKIPKRKRRNQRKKMNPGRNHFMNIKILDLKVFSAFTG
jgi:hypothetical protein